MIQSIEFWNDTHHSKWLAALRILLGIFIFAKGVAFISNTEALIDLINQSSFNFYAFILAHYVACAHLVGGIMIMLGAQTRIFIAFQLPILLGAILFVNITNGFSALNSELWLSILVFVLLVFFFIHGSDEWSFDKMGKKND